MTYGGHNKKHISCCCHRASYGSRPEAQPKAAYDGKSSSPKTYSSSSLLSSGKSPFLRKKLLASRIIGSRIFSGKTPLSALVFTTPVETSLPFFSSLPPWLSRT